MSINFRYRTDLSRLLCISIFLCFFDAVLRVEQKSGLTFDRFFLLLPVGALAFYETRAYLKMIGVFVLFVVYNLVLSARFGSFEYYTEMTFHYLVIFHLFFFVVYLVGSPHGGRDALLRTVKLGCFAMIGITLLQFVFHFHLPNVDIYGNDEFSGFFRIANDQSLALATSVPVLFLMWKEKKIQGPGVWAVLLSIFFICMHNHTKTALGAVLLYCALYVAVTLRVRISVGLAAIVLLVLATKDVTLHISYQEYTVEDLIIAPVRNLVSMQSYEEIGSIETRVNASIIGIRALFNSYMLGIGYGNSVTLLAMPENELDMAKSLHNDTLAFLLEEGLVALAIYVYGIARAMAMSRGRRDYAANIKLVCYYAFPVAILSSSGVTANYYFLTCLFLLINVKGSVTAPDKRRSALRAMLVRLTKAARARNAVSSAGRAGYKST
jgi:hypothetical protein